MKTWQCLVLACFCVAAFLFVRLFNIQEGFHLFNDMGRDLLVLQQWGVSGKPPLLGPQNSSLPFNQPGLYFYWLMPLFVLTGSSPWSLLATLFVTVISVFVGGLFLLRKKSEWWPIVLSFSWLVAINPAHIQQNRFVWNPSFVTPFFAVASVALVQMRRKWHKYTVQLFVAALALAVSFSYSVVPAAVALMLLVAWWWRKEWKKIILIWGSFVGWNVILQLPTLVFELRYSFQLTRAVFGSLLSGSVKYEGVGIETKLQNLFQTVLGVHGWQQFGLIVVFLVTLVVNLWLLRQAKKRSQSNRESPSLFSSRDSVFLSFLFMFAGTFLLTVFAPVPLHPHYVFAIAVLALFVVASLRPALSLGFSALLTLVWLQNSVFLQHFVSARRSVEDTFACTKRVCAQEKDPIFVSVESSIHPYHNGPEFRYALGESGCDVKTVETEPGAARYMAVVEDSGDYQQGITDFNELTLFGPHTLVRSYQCSEALEVFILEKKESGLR